MNEYKTISGHVVTQEQMELIRSEVLIATGEILQDEEVLRIVDFIKG